MIKIEKDNSKKQVAKTDASPEKLRGKNLFPKKLEKANEVILRVGLPKN